MYKFWGHKYLSMWIQEKKGLIECIPRINIARVNWLTVSFNKVDKRIILGINKHGGVDILVYYRKKCVT